MSYALYYAEEARKRLKKLPFPVKTRIIASLERCRIRPHAHAKKLVGSPYYSLRVGEYRVILDIKDGRLIIMVITLGHRKHIYKNL